MQAVGITRKAAISFLSNITLDEASNSKNDKINKDHSQNRYFNSNSRFATVESSDPQLDIPPDPDLERNSRIRSTSFSSNSINPAHKTLVSKRDRAATKFLLNITTSSPVITERQALSKSPTKPFNMNSGLKDSLSLPYRATTAPNGLLNKSQTGITSERIIISSSSSDSSSDEDQQFYRGTGSYTDEDVQLSSSKKSSYLIDLSASKDLTATQAMNFSPVFANVSHFESNSNTIPKKTNRRSRMGKNPKKSGTKRNTDSYAHLLSPKKTLVPAPPSDYNPLFLDDPSVELEIKTSGLYSIMDSLMQFAKTGESTIEPDDSFLLVHPSVDISLNLSLIRSIKAKMLAVAQQLDLELASVAHAFAYFEKLCLRGLVNKDTRRIKGATCLFLATKVNEHKRKLEGFLDAIDKFLDVSEKEVRAIEFATFAELEFNLFLPKSEFIPHLERILKEIGKSDIESYVEKRTFYLHYPEQSVLISS